MYQVLHDRILEQINQSPARVKEKYPGVHMFGKGLKCENPKCPSTILQPKFCSRPVSDQDAASLDTLVADRVKSAPATKQMRAKYAEEVLNEVTQKILGKPLQAAVKQMQFGRAKNFAVQPHCSGSSLSTWRLKIRFSLCMPTGTCQVA